MAETNSRKWSNGARSPLKTATALNKAKRLLVQGHLVKDVADEMGYSSASAFSAAFEARTDETPTAYYNRATSA